MLVRRSMSTGFDRALAQRDLRQAARAYALEYGGRHTGSYRTAWLEFRRLIRTTEDLRRWRAAVALTGPERAMQAEFASDFALALKGSVLDDVCGVLADTVAHALGAARAAMADAQLLDPRTGGLRLIAHSGFSEEFIEFFGLVDGEGSACGVALRTGRPVWVSDIERSTIFARSQALDVMLDAGSRAVTSVPILSAAGRPIAMISTHHTRPNGRTDQRMRRLERVARSTGELLTDLIWR